MTSAGKQKLGPLEHVRVGLGRDQVFESRKVPLLGVVFDGVERSKAHRGIVGGELEADQSGADHGLYAAIGPELADLAAGGGAEPLAAGDVDERQGIGVGGPPRRTKRPSLSRW